MASDMPNKTYYEISLGWFQPQDSINSFIISSATTTTVYPCLWAVFILLYWLLRKDFYCACIYIRQYGVIQSDQLYWVLCNSLEIWHNYWLTVKIKDHCKNIISKSVMMWLNLIKKVWVPTYCVGEIQCVKRLQVLILGASLHITYNAIFIICLAKILQLFF